MNDKNEIRFHYLYKNFSFANRSIVKTILIDIFKKETAAFKTLDYIFCNDNYLLEINRHFLNHHDLTDIITFDLAGTKGFVIGEIYISIERVKENAGIFGTSFKNELLRVLFHGALHLCGYSDKSLKDKSGMRVKEEYYISRFENVKKNVSRGTHL